MSKKMKRISVFALALLMLALCALPAMAGTYTPLDGADTGTYTLTEQMKLEKADTPKPTVTYTFAVTTTGNPAVSGTFGLAGGATGVPTISSGDTVTYNSSTEYTAGDGTDYSRVSNPVHNVVFDFSNVEYTLPGVYYWTITKTASNFDSNEKDVTNNNIASPSTTPATIQTMYLYAIVTNKDSTGTGNTDNTLQVTYGIYEADDEDDNLTTKDNTIEDKYPASLRDLTLKKIVAGNQGDRTKPFTFTISLTGTGSNTYTLNYADDQNTGSWGPNHPTEISFGTPVTVDLKHDQSVTVVGLPEGVSYTITETGVSSGNTTDGYAVSAVVSDGDNNLGVTNNANSTGIVSDTALGLDGATVTYTNNKTTTPPTGIIMQVGAPIAGILLVCGLFAVLIVSKRKKQREAE